MESGCLQFLNHITSFSMGIRTFLFFSKYSASEVPQSFLLLQFFLKPNFDNYNCLSPTLLTAVIFLNMCHSLSCQIQVRWVVLYQLTLTLFDESLTSAKSDKYYYDTLC